MGANGCGGQMTRDEAVKAAAFLRREIMPRMSDEERMHADGEVSPVPKESRLISELSSHELYAASQLCVERFAAFCEASEGFKVY